MAVGLTKPWGAAVAKNVRDFYETLCEKDRRRFAAVQARQVGDGSVRAMAEVWGCSRRTIERGRAEREALPQNPAVGQVRRPGAGRNKVLPGSPFAQHVQAVLATRTAGDPDDAQACAPLCLRPSCPAPWPTGEHR